MGLNVPPEFQGTLALATTQGTVCYCWLCFQRDLLKLLNPNLCEDATLDSSPANTFKRPSLKVPSLKLTKVSERKALLGGKKDLNDTYFKVHLWGKPDQPGMCFKVTKVQALSLVGSNGQVQST